MDSKTFPMSPRSSLYLQQLLRSLKMGGGHDRTSWPRYHIYTKNFQHTAKCSSLKGHRTTRGCYKHNLQGLWERALLETCVAFSRPKIVAKQSHLRCILLIKKRAKQRDLGGSATHAQALFQDKCKKQWRILLLRKKRQRTCCTFV